MTRATLQIIFILLLFLSAAPSSAITTIPETDFVVSRERTANADYVQNFHIVYDEDLGDASASFLSARAEAELHQLSDMNNPIPGFAQATMSSSGITNAYISAQVTGSSSELGYHVLTGQVYEVITGVIPGSTSTYNVMYTFNINDMFVEIWDDYGLDGVYKSIDATLIYDVTLDRNIGYRVKVQVEGTRDHDIAVRTEISSFDDDLSTETLGFSEVSSVPGDVPRRIVFDDISETELLLGIVETTGIPGETFEVEVKMSVQLRVPNDAWGAGARVNITDPNTLGTFGQLFLTETNIPTSSTPHKIPSLSVYGLGILTVLIGIIGFRRHLK